LRKIKIGVKLKELFQDQIPQADINFIVLEKNNKIEEIDFIIFSKENTPLINLSVYGDSINKLEKKYKIKINIKEKKSTELLNTNYNGNKFFGYLSNKTYNYEKEFSIEQIISNNTRQDILFANIEVKIDKKNIPFGEYVSKEPLY
jgi:hypothetical protein